MPESRRSLTRRAFTTTGLATVAALGGAPLAAFQSAPMGKPVGAEVEAANVKVVNAFCAAFAKKDIDTIGSLLADDCTYRLLQNRPAVVGKAAVVETIKGFLGRGLDFKVLKTVVLGPLVLNERDDVIGAAAGQPARTIRVNAGMFYLQNGKIVEWTDYVLP
jgi:limonene-1,2-epoxide hydrolase